MDKPPSPDGQEVFKNKRMSIEVGQLEKGSCLYYAVIGFKPDPDDRSFPARESAELIKQAFAGLVPGKILQIIDLRNYAGFPDAIVPALKAHRAAAGDTPTVIILESSIWGPIVGVATKFFKRIKQVRDPKDALVTAKEVNNGLAANDMQKLQNALGVKELEG